MNFKNLIIFAVMVLALTGCKTTTQNNLSYFRNLGDAASGVMPQGSGYDIKIAPEDELSIVISSAVPEATAMYNQPQANIARRGDYNTQPMPRLQTYIVDKQGDIMMPVLGKLNVAGKSTSEIEQMITSRLSSTVKDPFVRVELTGFYVNVMGEGIELVQILDVNGRTVLTADAGSINISSLANGVYFVRAITAKGVATQKIVKK